MITWRAMQILCALEKREERAILLEEMQKKSGKITVKLMNLDA